MEFTFDVSQTPLIGRRILMKSETEGNQLAAAANRNNSGPTAAAYLTHNPLSGTPSSPRRSASLSPADVAPLSGWKRPWMSQSRVRECLVNLLTTCGQRVGLPKSPSVSVHDEYYAITLLIVVGLAHITMSDMADIKVTNVCLQIYSFKCETHLQIVIKRIY